jgi:putative methionine-R-sulfoxide reductase with GAF domain
MEKVLQGQVQVRHPLREHVRSMYYEHAKLIHVLTIMLILLTGSLDFVIAQKTRFVLSPTLWVCAVLGLLLILLREFRSRRRLAFSVEKLRVLDQERAELFEREKRRTVQLSAMQRMSRTFSSILDFYAVFKEVAYLLQTSFGYEHVSIFGLDGRGHLALKALVDTSSDAQIPDVFLSDEKSGMCRARNSGKVLLSEARVNQAQIEGALHRGTRSQLCVPLRYSSRTLGLINVESEKDQAFAEEDITFLQTLSDYLAIWANNASLYNEIYRKTGAVQALDTIGKFVRFDLDIGRFFVLIFHEVIRYCPVRIFSLPCL